MEGKAQRHAVFLSHSVNSKLYNVSLFISTREPAVKTGLSVQKDALRKFCFALLTRSYYVSEI